jgi:hypothetical protein
MGPLLVEETTRQQLVVQAREGGDLRWDSDAAVHSSTQRVVQMLQLIRATHEYQIT